MSKDAQRILFLCSRLDVPGGIERAVVNTANLLQAGGYSVTILILDDFRGSFYLLNDEVRVQQVPLDFGIAEKGNFLTKKIRFLTQVQQLRKHLNEIKPDAVVGTEYPLVIAAYLAIRRSGLRIYAWEHHHFHWLGKSRFWQTLFERVYRRVDAVICLNETEQKLFTDAGCRTVVIPNFVERKVKASLQQKTILSIGWIIQRKGFDRVSAIAKQVFEKHPDWKWKIIGTGPGEESLNKQLTKTGLEENVILQKPSSPDLEGEYANASVFALTSRFECLPMVLLEAMAQGLPCVSFDCPTGPSFIINDKIDGLLVPPDDVDAFASALSGLLSDGEKRKGFGDAAYENVQRFSSAAVYERWRDLLSASFSD